MDGNYKKVCWRDTILGEAAKLLPPEFLISDSWDQSQDTLTNQDFPQNSAQIEENNFIKESTSKKELRVFDRDDQDETLDDRPWKKIKSDSDLKELFEEEPISTISSNKFYSNIEDYYEKKQDLAGEDVLKNASSDSDSDSVAENVHASLSSKCKRIDNFLSVT